MDKTNIEYVLPEEIEMRSFEIIAAELAERGITLPAEQDMITRRVIHTSADFDYAQTMTYSENAVEIAKDLLKNGADEVIYPDRDMAERVAKKYSANHVLDYVALNDDYSIYEINPPEGWVGKSIKENNVRQKYNVNIVTVKEAGKNRVLPLPDYVFKADDAVMVLGLNADVDKLVRKL